jgi:hypothetical protein
MNGNEIDQTADAEKYEFIVDDVLEQGSVNLMSGRSTSGKTYIFTHGCGAIMEGGEFLGHKCKPTPILYLNCDMNRIKRLRNNIKRGMQSPDNEEIFSKFMFMSKNVCLPSTLTAKHLDAYATNVQAKLAAQGITSPILIIVDTFRSAFMQDAEMGAENDSSIMKHIKPIREWAVKSMNSVFIMHHNNKRADDYVGSGAFLMPLDSKWNYRRKEEEPTGKLSITTRGEYYATYEIGIDLQTKLPVVIEQKQGLDDFAIAFGTGSTIKEALAYYNDKATTKVSEDTIIRRAKEAREVGLLTIVREKAGTYPAIYAHRPIM